MMIRVLQWFNDIPSPPITANSNISRGFGITRIPFPKIPHPSHQTQLANPNPHRTPRGVFRWYRIPEPRSRIGSNWSKRCDPLPHEHRGCLAFFPIGRTGRRFPAQKESPNSHVHLDTGQSLKLRVGPPDKIPSSCNKETHDEARKQSWPSRSLRSFLPLPTP